MRVTWSLGQSGDVGGGAKVNSVGDEPGLSGVVGACLGLGAAIGMRQVVCVGQRRTAAHMADGGSWMEAAKGDAALDMVFWL